MTDCYDPSPRDNFTPESLRISLLDTFRAGQEGHFHVKTPGKGRFRHDEQNFEGMTPGRMELLLCKEKKLVFSLSSMAREVVADCILMSNRCKDLVGLIPKRMAREVYYNMQPITPAREFRDVDTDDTCWTFLPDYETPQWRVSHYWNFYVYQQQLAWENYKNSLQSMIGEVSIARRIPIFKEKIPERLSHISQVWYTDFVAFLYDIEDFTKHIYVEALDDYKPPVFFNLDETGCGCRDCPEFITVLCELRIPFKPWQHLLNSGRTIVASHFEDYYNSQARRHRASVTDGFMDR